MLLAPVACTAKDPLLSTECPSPSALSVPWLQGGGELGELIRAMDWSRTALGPPESWPASLRTAISICLGSRFPILLWWGPDFVMLYNDGYRPMLGSKHPRSLGQHGSECWAEIWHIIGPMLDGVRNRGEATWSDDQMLSVYRIGFTEESYFTYTYSPIPNDAGRVEGVFCAVMETTERVLAARRLATLRALAANAPAAHNATIACCDAVTTLVATPEDTPYAAMYLLSDDGSTLSRVATAGFEDGDTSLPAFVRLGAAEGELEHALAAACTTDVAEACRIVSAAEARLPPLQSRPWPDPIQNVVCLGVTQPGQPRPSGVLLVAISPRRPLDSHYRSFLELAAGHVATAIANSRSHEEERRRARMLAELDRAKTTFFTNVSHEFRTPLTLMLGPLEHVLALGRDELPDRLRTELQTIYRNALRLLKLVNTLLDFSRIEAGRADATRFIDFRSIISTVPGSEPMPSTETKA